MLSVIENSTVIVPADARTLGSDIDRFLDELRTERRYFGPTGAANPKPFPSLIEALGKRGGFRLAAIECGQIIGIVRIDGGGELFTAVVADRRGQGVGTLLCQAAVERAHLLGYQRLTMRSAQRSVAARRVWERLGCLIVDRVDGRTDLVFTPREMSPLRRSA